MVATSRNVLKSDYAQPDDHRGDAMRFSSEQVESTFDRDCHGKLDEVPLLPSLPSGLT
jgi:hypothetical protein